MKNKRTTLQKGLFKKYIIGFIIFQIIFQVITQAGISALTFMSVRNVFSSKDVYEQIDEKGIEKVYKDKKLPENTYIEILDLNYKVINSINSPHRTGYIYDKQTIKNISNGSISNLKLHFLSKHQELLIVKEQSLNSKSIVFVVFILVFIFLILFITITFFKIMAKIVSGTLEKPLNKLINGINEFKNKNYGYRIDFTANNEFDDLKNAFNDMADTLDKETALRLEAQNTNRSLILDITHDLKTPLTNIKGYSELLRDNKDLNDETKNQYLDIIISNSQRSSKLITDLFDMTYCDLKSTGFIKQKKDFSEMLRRLLVEYIGVFEDRNNEYEFNIPNYPVYVCIDCKMIERAICNILNNFLKYGGEKTKVEVTLNDYSNDVELIISDNGPGIPKEKCDEAFLPFVTADPSRNPMLGGTGLGLSIAKKVFENHNGSIKLISDTGKGCTFIIKMPKDGV